MRPTEPAETSLSEPYLLDPQADRVTVVWHTAGSDGRHAVLTGPAVADLSPAEALAAVGADHGQTTDMDSDPGQLTVTIADSTRLSQMREDADSQLPGRRFDAVTPRSVYRHLAVVRGLPLGRTAYRVVSVDTVGTFVSATYTLAPAVPSGEPVRLLLTSDHQLAPMVGANLTAVARTVGTELDGALLAGDMVNVPDRASDWFDHAGGSAFFAVMTGRAAAPCGGRRWPGAPLLQNTPLYPAPGNHDVMGERPDLPTLHEQFRQPLPKRWNTTTYRELFPVPASTQGEQLYWARTIGDVHLVSLFAASVWRPYTHLIDSDEVPTKHRERAADVGDPDRHAGGQFIFEAFDRDSAQYRWLEAELHSERAKLARYLVVMLHQSGHGIGVHPPMAVTNPVPTVTRDPVTGQPTAIDYQYPVEADFVLRDLEPLFDATGVHLVLAGHAHLWQRFRSPAGVHWLETSNVGNSFGAYHRTSGQCRPLPSDTADEPMQGDPGGWEPVVPTVAPLVDERGTALPYLASNEITAFSVMDTAAGVVRSYRFDTRTPDQPAVLFDEFAIAEER